MRKGFCVITFRDELGVAAPKTSIVGAIDALAPYLAAVCAGAVRLKRTQIKTAADADGSRPVEENSVIHNLLQGSRRCVRSPSARAFKEHEKTRQTPTPMHEKQLQQVATPYSQLREEQLDELRKKVGDAMFTSNDVARLLNLSVHTAGKLNRYGVDTHRIKRVATAFAMQEFGVPQPCFDMFSFDFSKTEEDALDPYDPIPRAERTLDLQLFDEELVRYYEVRNYIFEGTPPPKPNDRPFDQWEQTVFHEGNDSNEEK